MFGQTTLTVRSSFDGLDLRSMTLIMLESTFNIGYMVGGGWLSIVTP